MPEMQDHKVPQPQLETDGERVRTRPLRELRGPALREGFRCVSTVCGGASQEQLPRTGN